MDILQELPLDQWPILQKKLKKLWPINIGGYYALHLNLKYPEIREMLQLKVYTLHGDIDNGFVGILNIKGVQFCILFSTTEDTSQLEEAIIKTNFIDWNKTVTFDLINSLTLQCIGRVNDVMHFIKYEIRVVKLLILERTTKPFTVLRLPENTYTGPVKSEDITRVDNVWPYNHPTSHSYFTTLASNGLSYGLYSQNHELLAWVFVNGYNFLCHLFCEEGDRRKGYAEYIIKWAVNEQLIDGNDVYVYVAEGNYKPSALFKKLGFKLVDDSAFMTVKKLTLEIVRHLDTKKYFYNKN